jgi:hypothetical protein
MTASEPPKSKIAAALRRVAAGRGRSQSDPFVPNGVHFCEPPHLVDSHPCCNRLRCDRRCCSQYRIFMDGFGACKTVVRNSMPSPDGTKSIVIFGKECGATVGFNTQVSIAPSGGSFSQEKSPAFFAISGEHSIMAKWLGDSTVEISSVPEGERVLKSEQRVGEIRITYK